MGTTCALSGTLINLDGTAMSFAHLRAEYIGVPGSGGVLFQNKLAPSPHAISAYTAKDGTFVINLMQGVCFDVFLPGEDDPVRMLVPAEDNGRLADYLYPRPSEIDWSELSVGVDGTVTYPDLSYHHDGGFLHVELNAGETINIALRVKYSDGRVTAFTSDALSATPNPGYAVIEGQALAITQPNPGDVTVVTQNVDDPFEIDDSALPVILIPESDFDITLPVDLAVRFV